MTSSGELAIDHQMAAEDDENTLERMPDPAGPLLTENPQPVAPRLRPGIRALPRWPPLRTNRKSPARVTRRDP